MSNKLQAIHALYPDVFSTKETSQGITVIDSNGNNYPVDWAAVDAKAAELDAAIIASQYQRDRADAYPSIQEQLDMQYWDNINGTTVWADTIQSIKNQYPKPEN